MDRTHKIERNEIVKHIEKIFKTNEGQTKQTKTKIIDETQ